MDQRGLGILSEPELTFVFPSTGAKLVDLLEGAFPSGERVDADAEYGVDAECGRTVPTASDTICV